MAERIVRAIANRNFGTRYGGTEEAGRCLVEWLLEGATGTMTLTLDDGRRVELKPKKAFTKGGKKLVLDVEYG